MAAVSLALTGFAVTAFGLASPPVPDVTQRIVTEIVTPTDIPAQLETLAAHDLALYRSDLTRASDTADSLLRRLGVLDPQAAAFLRTDPTARRLLEGRAGKMAQVRARSNGLLEELVVRFAALDPSQADTHFTRLRVVRFDSRFQAALETAPLQTQVRLGSGTVTSSLFAATDDAKLPDDVASQIAEMFSTEIDFHRDLRRGDTFSVLYEARTADGEPITWNAAAGRVLAAEFVNDGESHAAVWYQDASGKGAYFGFDGRSKQHSFLASPMEFSRVTSGFAMRMHPILNRWKQHNGVDYAAPTGTPVRTVGDGVVTFAGRQNGYGNVIEIRHSNDRETVYAHLSRIDVRLGEHVEQGTAHRRGRRDRLGHRPAPALRIQGRRLTPGSDGDRQVVRDRRDPAGRAAALHGTGAELPRPARRRDRGGLLRALLRVTHRGTPARGPHCGPFSDGRRAQCARMTALTIGLMSGTSLDGVDAVLADFGAPGGFAVRAHAHRPFPSALAAELLALNAPGENELHRAALAANGLVRGVRAGGGRRAP